MPTDIIQWFPGHMAKTKRLIKESLPEVDVVIELLDARIPRSSKNPDLEALVTTKPIVTLLNKASLADPDASARLKKKYADLGKTLIITDCVSGKGIDELEAEIKRILADKIERYREKGMAGRSVKAMVLGIPNVGKSSLINKLSGTKKAAKNLAEIISVFNRADYDVRVYVTARQGDATLAVHRLGKEMDLAGIISM